MPVGIDGLEDKQEGIRRVEPEGCWKQGYPAGGQRSADTDAVYGDIKMPADAVVIINELAEKGAGVGVILKRQC